MAGQSSSQAASPFQWWKPALFFLVVIVGLWFVKWQPYYGKAFTAAETHSIGKSILAQADANPFKAAWDYAAVYFLAVWKAAVLGVLLGSLIQVLIPRDWLLRTLGQSRFRGTLSGVLFSLPGMMCTCCAAPVAAGMRKQQVSMGGALAFWMGNPLLNPATLVFMGFVLGWQFALIRLVAGLATVLIVATLVQKWVKEAATQPSDLPAVDDTAQGPFLSRWLRALWTLFWNTIPVYILAVLVLVFGPKKLGWLVPGPDEAVTGYAMYRLFSVDGAYDPTEEGVEELRAVLDDTWVLWWGVSNSIPMKDREDHPFRLEIYTEERIPAATFCLGSDGLLYAGKLRFRPLNADLRAALEPLAEQWEQEHKNGGDG